MSTTPYKHMENTSVQHVETKKTRATTTISDNACAEVPSKRKNESEW